jgi:hypothetical protein
MPDSDDDPLDRGSDFLVQRYPTVRPGGPCLRRPDPAVISQMVTINMATAIGRHAYMEFQRRGIAVSGATPGANVFGANVFTDSMWAAALAPQDINEEPFSFNPPDDYVY